MNSRRLRQHAEDLHKHKAEEIARTKEGTWAQSPTPVEEMIQIYLKGKREPDSCSEAG